jgi:hypothetical protein
MSALGHKRTLKRLHPMSAIPPKADIVGRCWMSALCQTETFRTPSFFGPRLNLSPGSVTALGEGQKSESIRRGARGGGGLGPKMGEADYERR